MNEDKNKVYLGNLSKSSYTWQSGWVKPASKFWKRYFNKKVRNGQEHKRGNWFNWS